MYKKIEHYITELTSDFNSISDSRKQQLSEVAKYIQQKIATSETAKLNFICTHNSRRSHLSQLWAGTAAFYYGIDKVETYSGGTEATAFNPRAVAAIQRAGFNIEHSGGDNPLYKVYFDEQNEPFTCFSKKFDDQVNPTSSFAAIMTCSDADENCPFVPGTEYRASITYRDPKESDDSLIESKIYDERCKQIATEMFYMMNLIDK